VAGQDLEERIDTLYDLALEAFVPERNALAKALRAEKRREDAKTVAALRRPSAAAWAVNQVVRSQPAAARALWKAGDELAGAQAAVVAGTGDGAKLRAAMRAHREALAPVSEALRGLLTGDGRGLGAETVQAAIGTLNAASLDAELRDEVARGRAQAAAELSGFEGGLGAPASPAPAARPKRRAKPKPKPKPEPDPEPEPPAPSEAELREAERRREAVEAAEQALAAAQRERADAAERAADARKALRAAEAADEEARTRLGDARDAEAAAGDALDRLRAGES